MQTSEIEMRSRGPWDARLLIECFAVLNTAGVPYSCMAVAAVETMATPRGSLYVLRVRVPATDASGAVSAAGAWLEQRGLFAGVTATPIEGG